MTATVDVYDTLGKPELAGKLNVTYRLHVANTEEKAEAYELMQGNDAKALMTFGADVIAKTIAAWDLLGKDGKPMPITPATIKKIPDTILNDISRAINLDRTPSKSEGAASSSA